MTATALSRELQCNSAAVAKLLHPDEWHHTSAKYNCTNYYSEPALVIVANERFATFSDRRDALRVAFQEGLRASDLRDAFTTLARLRDWRPQGEGRFKGCTARWTEWFGSGRRKTSEEIEYKDVEVTIKGAYATVHTQGGDVRKKRNGNWFILTVGEEVACG